MIDLLLINFIIVEVWDVLNFPNEIASKILNCLSKGKINNVTLKPPLGCSFCLVFWVSLIVLIVGNQPILYAITLSLLNAMLTRLMLYILNLFNNIVDILFSKIHNLIDK